MPAVEVHLPAVEAPLRKREEGRTAPSKEAEEVEKTVAKVAGTEQVAGAAADDDEALRTGAGG